MVSKQIRKTSPPPRDHGYWNHQRAEAVSHLESKLTADISWVTAVVLNRSQYMKGIRCQEPISREIAPRMGDWRQIGLAAHWPQPDFPPPDSWLPPAAIAVFRKIPKSARFIARFSPRFAME